MYPPPLPPGSQYGADRSFHRQYLWCSWEEHLDGMFNFYHVTFTADPENRARPLPAVRDKQS